MELSGSIIMFFQKKTFLIFWQTKTPKKFLIFQETELSYVSGNLETVLCFRKWNFLATSLKVMSATFLLVCFLCLKESTCETRKNVFCFTSKALFVLKTIKL